MRKIKKFPAPNFTRYRIPKSVLWSELYEDKYIKISISIKEESVYRSNLKKFAVEGSLRDVNKRILFSRNVYTNYREALCKYISLVYEIESKNNTLGI